MKVFTGWSPGHIFGLLALSFEVLTASFLLSFSSLARVKPRPAFLWQGMARSYIAFSTGLRRTGATTSLLWARRQGKQKLGIICCPQNVVSGMEPGL